MGTWLTAEMSLFAGVLQKKTTKRVTRADLLPVAFSKVRFFSHDTWADFINKKAEDWVPTPQVVPKETRKRRGPSDEQEMIFKEISAKIVRRKRSRVLIHPGKERRRLRTG